MKVTFPKQVPKHVRWGVCSVPSGDNKAQSIRVMVGITDKGAICRLDFFKKLAKDHLNLWKSEWPITLFVRDDKAIASVAHKFITQPDDIHVQMVGTDFQQSVWRVLSKIPRGKTLSYAEVAQRVGKPKASRAVGSACGKNPVPLIIPCHRVLASGGGLGGFSGGLPVKKILLKAEGVLVKKAA